MSKVTSPNFERIAYICHKICHFEICDFPIHIYVRGLQLPLLGNHKNEVFQRMQKPKIQKYIYLNFT